MGQTLTNGIFLPNEGERNCYTGLAGNWRALDYLIGGYNVHVDDLVIHVSQADRDKWDAVDNKADASALTAHTGDTTIHVTAADKQTWNTGVTQAYVLRYASVPLTALGTVAFSALDNTDNVKIGDKVLDSDGKLFALTAVDTQNSTFTIGIALIDLHSSTNVALPIGSYIQFAGSQAPDGFLVCNGGEISRTTYSALFAVIGTTYGSGDGSTTFNLPNLTDRFLQGSTTVGTYKSAGLPNITGDVQIYSPWTNASESGALKTTTQSESFVAGQAYQTRTNRLYFDASRSSSIYGNSNTVQPPALTCLICIKY